MAANKERFLRISRRVSAKNWVKVVQISGAIVFAFLICALISTLVAPGSFGDYFVYLFQGTFYTPNITLMLFWNTAFLFAIAIALIPVFKMRYWNIGAEGQCLMGALGCLIGMYFIAPHVTPFIAILIELILALVFATIWALIPAIFKAFLNTNETLFTLMMNYIAMGIVTAFVMAFSNSSTNTINPLNEDTHLGWLPIIEYFNNSYIINIIFIVIVAVIIWIYMRFTKHGYELSVVGGSRNTARYVGINVKKVILRTVTLTGLICGLIGFLYVAGSAHSINPNSIGGRGFTAVMICWIGEFSVPLIAFYSFLITFVSTGSATAASWLGYPKSVSDVSTAIFFIIIIASTFFINFKVNVKLPEKIKEFFAWLPLIKKKEKNVEEVKEVKKEENK